MRTRYITVRMTEEEFAAAEQMARSVGVSTPEVLRHLLRMAQRMNLIERCEPRHVPPPAERVRLRRGRGTPQ